MKIAIIQLTLLLGIAMRTFAYDFQSGNLLYSIISTNPPQVSVDGHVDGMAAQGELFIPETVYQEDVTYTVTQIGYMAFARCSGLKGYLTIPNTVNVIETGAFRDCSGFTGDLVIPNSVTLLRGMAFLNCTGFDGHLTLSNSISKIYGSTFCGCSGLNGTLVIPNSVTEIAAQAFTSCGFTGTLVIPNSVTLISMDFNDTYEGYGSFQGCTGLTELKLPESLPIIGDYCFAQCYGLSGKLVIPEGVTEIWNHAFWSCDNLSSVEFPNSLAVIGYASFEGCQALADTLEIPCDTRIYGYAFSGCQNINAIILHPGVQITGYYIFDHCSSLTEIRIPEGWEKTCHGTFNCCYSLSKVYLPESLKTIDNACFKDCHNLSEINLHEGITSIGTSAFSHCFGLSEDLRIPNSVEAVNPYAFDSCYNIKRVKLGNSVKHLAEESFRHIPLDNLSILALDPPLMEHLYWQFPRDLSITIPCGTLTDYQESESWSSFTNMSEGLPYSLLVRSDDEVLGSVSVLKEASCKNISAKVEAIPSEGSLFLYWEIHGEQVSTDNPYSFDLEEDMELVAHFSGMGLKETVECVSAYPNPSKDQLHLQFSPDVTPTQIELYDLQGRLVRSQRNGLERLEIHGLAAGTYTMRVTLEDGKVFSDKVVKE